MTKLSPAALAVWEAFNEDEPGTFIDYGNCLAAALRATADQLIPNESAPTGMMPAGDVYSAREIRRGQRQETRSQLLAIAAELEAK